MNRSTAQGSIAQARRPGAVTEPSDSDFAPTATLPVLRLRAAMLDWLRQFFREHGYWEVETPLLSHDVCVDAWLEPFRVPGELSGEQTTYLQTSPEFGMKRLLAAGADSIFQITRAFRQEESGRLHNPEFTIVEWYCVGTTYHDQMDFVEELAGGFQEALWQFQELPRQDDVLAGGCSHAVDSLPDPRRLPAIARPISRLTYAEAFARALGESVLSLPTERLAKIAVEREIGFPQSLRADDRDGWLNLLFLEMVEPMLAEEQAVFVCDYPASQAALARIRSDDPPVAERFELYLRGLEICNGYQELTDPAELQRRFAVQTEKRRRDGRPDLPVHSRLIDAMQSGLPDCSGVALGFDRLLLALLGGNSLDEVMAFPFSRA